MEVGQQHRRVAVQAHAAQGAGRALAGVDDELSLAGDDRGAGTAAVAVRKGTAGAADDHVQAVGQGAEGRGGHGGGQPALHDLQGQLVAHEIRAARHHEEQDQQPRKHPFHVASQFRLLAGIILA